MAALTKINEAQYAKGEAILADAERAKGKALKAGFMSSLLGSSKEVKCEDAAELYQKAGNAFKMAKGWQEAGKAYSEAGQMHLEIKSNSYDAGNLFKDAGECFEKVFPEDAVNAWQQAIQIFSDSGKWSTCGKLQQSISEIYEREDGSEGSAIESYEQAIAFFDMDSHSKMKARACMEKMAALMVKVEDYLRAATCFEQLAEMCLASNLTSMGAKAHMLKVIYCSLCAEDPVAARTKLSEFVAKDYTFGSAREGEFATQLVEAYTAEDAQAFGQACADFNTIRKLPPDAISMLSKCKRAITVEEDPEPEPVDEDTLEANPQDDEEEEELDDLC